MRGPGLAVALLLGFAAGTSADDPVTPGDLLAQDRLQVDSAILPADNVVPGQKLRLVLEVATDRWFAGGTRIVVPEVPGLIILQTEQFASNASENRNGQSWVIQRWTLDVYPQKAGAFTIPPVSLEVQVNAGEAGNVSGRVMSPPAQFTASIPASLSAIEAWVAAPGFAVSQTFDRPLEELKVGEAFEREVIFEASDVMAMMLPAFEPEKIPGLAVYPSPPRLDNSSNRGETRARRSQRISYVIQAEGEYLLPGGDFHWWNTSEGELRMLSLPVTRVVVGSAGGTIGDMGKEPKLTRAQWLQLLGGVALLVVMILLGRVLLSRLPLEQARVAAKRGWKTLADLRKPALPERLNPGSSAGE